MNAENKTCFEIAEKAYRYKFQPENYTSILNDAVSTNQKFSEGIFTNVEIAAVTL